MKKTVKVSVITSLYNCLEYLNGYFDAVESICDKSEIEFLLLHNDPKVEELELINKKIDGKDHFRYIKVEKLEGLYTTWNRGIKLSSGEYITIWNVDDIRLPDSILRQQKCLDNNPSAALTYGDIIISNEYGNSSGRVIAEPQFSRDNLQFYRQHIIGCFPMWKKSIHDEIGYFDEQFRLVADFDFQIRTVRRYDIVKTDGVLGYYLEYVSTKLSSNRKLQKNETNALVRRYGIYDRFDLFFWNTYSKYIDVENVYYNDIKHNIRELFREYDLFISERKKYKIRALIKQPRFFLAYIKHDIFNC